MSTKKQITVLAILSLASLTACNSESVVPAEVTASRLAPVGDAGGSPSPNPTATPYAYSGGTGDFYDPYILAVADDVDHIRDNPTASFSLNQSINMGGRNFAPIPSFSGTLFGNGFELDNLTIAVSDTTTAAMFLEMSGTVTAVKFYGAVISSQGYAAVVAGNLTGRLSLSDIQGTVTSTFGGNGFSGSGANGNRPAYVTKVGATFVSTTQDVYFNGSRVQGSVN